MKKIYLFALFALLGLAGSCKLDAPIYPGDKGYVADTPPGGAIGTGTGTGTSVPNGNGLPLGALNTLLYKVDGITYTCSTGISFAIDLKGNAYLTGQADAGQGPWVCLVNLNFIGNKVGTYSIMAPFILTNSTASAGFTNLTLINGKVAVTSINTDGYFGTLQGTFNANMQDDSGKVLNVTGSFNMKQ